MRKIIGSLSLVVWVIAYVAVAGVLGDRIAKEAWYWQVLFFPVAGLAWILPLKPLLRWMHQHDAPLERTDV
jgi:hypothetical protein